MVLHLADLLLGIHGAETFRSRLNGAPQCQHTLTWPWCVGLLSLVHCSHNTSTRKAIRKLISNNFITKNRRIQVPNALIYTKNQPYTRVALFARVYYIVGKE